jgi:GNAT superfamily N-acetyltransferase
MAPCTYTLEDAPRHEDIQKLSQGLTDYALPYTRVAGCKPLGVFLRDGNGEVVAGGLGQVNWNWLYVSLVSVSDALRGKGWGRRLMEEIEQAAKERGCEYAHLDTFSFEARSFYEALGYEVFGSLNDYPAGYEKLFMKKALK